MLIIDDDSVYEIDEECVRKNPVPPECMVYEKLRQKHQKEASRKNRNSGKYE